ncbi:MAG TPA: RES superfamily protein [Chitinophagaceae bacterium]|nr:RES superfamily protein [Chitinophagaceae bacterium]
MIVYRITHSRYKDDISGNGAKIKGARWNMAGSSMLYTAENISLSTLELLVHIGFNDIRHFYHLLAISLPDDAPVKEIHADKLKKNWQEDEDYTSFMGTAFLKDNSNLILKVPSAVIPEEHNYLVNPGHPDFKKVKIKKSRQYIFDERLYTFK